MGEGCWGARWELGRGERKVPAAHREAHTSLAGYSHFRSYTWAGAFSFASCERASEISVCVYVRVHTSTPLARTHSWTHTERQYPTSQQRLTLFLRRDDEATTASAAAPTLCYNDITLPTCVCVCIYIHKLARNTASPRISPPRAPCDTLRSPSETQSYFSKIRTNSRYSKLASQVSQK